MERALEFAAALDAICIRISLPLDDSSDNMLLAAASRQAMCTASAASISFCGSRASSSANAAETPVEVGIPCPGKVLRLSTLWRGWNFLPSATFNICRWPSRRCVLDPPIVSRQLTSHPMRPQTKPFTVQTKQNRKTPGQHLAELGVVSATAEPGRSPFVTAAERLLGTIGTSRPTPADGNLIDLTARTI